MKVINDESKNKYRSLLTKPVYRGLLYVIISLVIIGSFGLLFYNYNLNKIKESNDLEQFSEIELIVSEIQSQLRFSGTPLMLSSSNKSVVKVIEENDPSNKDVISQVLLSMISNMENIDQIRILDIDGNEIIRVDQDNKSVFRIIPEEELQNKGERYYFKETLEITDDSIYVSPLDLNIEYGEIELPTKPMLRIGKPISTENGEKIGAMIINVRGNVLLNTLEEFKVHKNDNIMLINSDGYYLSGGDELDFAFMYEDKKTLGFFSEYSNVWDDVLEGKNKIFDGADVFYVEKMNPIKSGKNVSDEVTWYILMQVFEEDIYEAERIFNKAVQFIVIIIGPLLILFSYLLGVTQAKNLSYKDDLLKSSTYDTLTGIYNRGFVMKVLHQSVDQARVNNKPLSILYIDINNLKYVNDNIGHNMGDNMIVAAGDSIKNAVRSSDIVARIGGDEFLVVLQNCIEENVNTIIVKISEAFLKKGIEYTNEPWEMSYGCAVLQKDETESQLIQRADRYMYENKRRKKDS